MKEKQITVNSAGRGLYGMAHYPGGEKEKYPVVIFFHGLTGTSIEPHRLFVKIARKLAARGVAAVRFDFCGAGQSEGDSEKTGFYDWARDAESILDFIRKDRSLDSDNMSAIGLSMGSAVLMYLLARKKINTGKNVFLSPAVMLKELITAMKENNRTENGCLVFNGSRISLKAVDETGKIDLFSMDYEKTGPALIIHSRDDKTVSVKASEILGKFFGEKGIKTELLLLDNGGHTFDIPSSEDAVIGKVLKWLVEESG